MMIIPRRFTVLAVTTLLISAVTGAGLEALLQAVWQSLAIET